MLSFRNALIRHQIANAPALGLSNYSLYKKVPKSEADFYFARLQRAVVLEPSNPTARWRLARAALSVGDARTSAEMLVPLTESAKRDPLLYLDSLIAFSRNGQSDKVIALYEAAPFLNQIQVVSDVVSLAYLEQGRIGQAFVLRPGDLYANELFWNRARSTGDSTAAGAYSETLAFFPASSVRPEDERLLRFVGKAVQTLIDNGVWQRDLAQRVMAILVWQYPKAPEIEQALMDLSTRYPSEPTWYALLTELHHRQSNLPPHTNTGQDFTALSEELGIGADNFELGDNLVGSARLNRTQAAEKDQSWATWGDSDSTLALSFIGLDEGESESALRISTVWRRPVPDGTSPPYAEFQHGVTLDPNADFVLSFDYKTDGMQEGSALVALMEYTAQPRLIFTHTALPDTAGEWRRWVVVGKSFREPIPLTLILRNWGVGTVWFDNVQLQKIQLK